MKKTKVNVDIKVLWEPGKISIDKVHYAEADGTASGVFTFVVPFPDDYIEIVMPVSFPVAETEEGAIVPSTEYEGGTFAFVGEHITEERRSIVKTVQHKRLGRDEEFV